MRKTILVILAALAAVTMLVLGTQVARADPVQRWVVVAHEPAVSHVYLDAKLNAAIVDAIGPLATIERTHEYVGGKRMYVATGASGERMTFYAAERPQRRWLVRTVQPVTTALWYERMDDDGDLVVREGPLLRTIQTRVEVLD